MRRYVSAALREDPVARSFVRLAFIGVFACAAAFCSATAKADTNLGSLLGASNCGATSSVFAPWGDQAQYYFATDGGFEAGGAGWTFGGGARVVAGNEPFYLHSAQDRASLLIPNGGVATSPSLCFGSNTPGIRFVATSPSGSAVLHVTIVARGPVGVLAILDGGTIRVGSTWEPTASFATTFSQLNSVLLGAKSIQVVITSSDGDAQIDDVYVDPFLQR
jgi:hypothetical protein